LRETPVQSGIHLAGRTTQYGEHPHPSLGRAYAYFTKQKSDPQKFSTTAEESQFRKV